tara:strand:- start:379 stop:534 length:156 start_codon:yes stop_codon:yes gene_type:complete
LDVSVEQNQDLKTKNKEAQINLKEVERENEQFKRQMDKTREEVLSGVHREL